MPFSAALGESTGARCSGSTEPAETEAIAGKMAGTLRAMFAEFGLGSERVASGG
jgi:hypothetical protein